MRVHARSRGLARRASAIVFSALLGVFYIGLVATPVELTDCAPNDPPTVAAMSIAPGDVPIGSTVELRYCAAAGG